MEWSDKMMTEKEAERKHKEQVSNWTRSEGHTPFKTTGLFFSFVWKPEQKQEDKKTAVCGTARGSCFTSLTSLFLCNGSIVSCYHMLYTHPHTHTPMRERGGEQECTTMFLCFLLLLQRFIECLWILHSAQHGNEKWNSLCLYLHSWQTSWISLGIIVFLFAWIAQLLAPSRIVTRYASAASWKQQRMYLSIQEIESWRSQWVTCYLHVWVPDVQLQSQVHNCLVWCYVRIFLFVLISTSNHLFSFALGNGWQ